MTTRYYQVLGKQLISMIANGEYKVGDKLPPERDISISMDVSRAIVREAIIMLELYGYVEVKKGSGVYITAIPGTEDIDNDSGDVGPFELLQARQVIESNITYIAAKSLTKNDVVTLKKTIERERADICNSEIGNKTSAYDNDKDFHFALAEATHNSILIDMMSLLWEKRRKSRMWRQLQTHIRTNEYRKTWLSHHESILHALVIRDAELAKREMYNHIQEVKTTLFKLSDVENPDFDGYLFDFDLFNEQK